MSYILNTNIIFAAVFVNRNVLYHTD